MPSHTMKTLLTILSLILLAGTSRGQTKPADPTIVWIIVGAGGAGVTCYSSGCDRPDVYWTGTGNSYADYLPKGWSLDRKDAKQYRIEDDPDHAVPNGRHCCYAENVTSIDPKTPQTKPETSKAAQPVIHPVIHIETDTEESSEVDAFMNTLEFTCPKGLVVVDTRHLLRPKMSYKDTINALGQMECHTPSPDLKKK